MSEYTNPQSNPLPAIPPPPGIPRLQSEIYAAFGGPVNENAVNRFFIGISGAIQGGVKRIHLLIQSTGGVVVDGVALYNYLTNLPIEIITYNAGAVQSIAVLAYLAGKVRKASANSQFMIHKTTYSPQGPQTAEMLRRFADSAEQFDGNTDAILKSHVRLTDEQWAARERSEIIIPAYEALKVGLIHEIADFAPPAGSQVFGV